MKNVIKTSKPCVYIIENVDGYKVVAIYGDDIEVLAKFKSLAIAQAWVKECE